MPKVKKKLKRRKGTPYSLKEKVLYSPSYQRWNTAIKKGDFKEAAHFSRKHAYEFPVGNISTAITMQAYRESKARRKQCFPSPKPETRPYFLP